jgi:hypothetical protein
MKIRPEMFMPHVEINIWILTLLCEFTSKCYENSE